MMIRRITQKLLLALGLVYCVASASSSTTTTKKEGEKAHPFQRLSRTLQDGAAADAAATATGDATSGGGIAAAVDAMNTGAIKILRDMLNGGDKYQAFRALTDLGDLEKAWTDPKVFKHALTVMPMLKSIKPIGDIVDKAGEITSEDSLAALAGFKQYLKAAANMMETFENPKSFAQKLQEYENDEGLLKELFQKMNAGDQEATKQLQQEIVNRELGGIVDLNQWGNNEIEPLQVTQMRDFLKAEEPDFYRLIHQDDPLIKQYVDDPFLAWREAKELMKSSSTEL